MEIVKSSIIGGLALRIWAFIANCWAYSIPAYICAAVARVFKKLWRGSAVIKFLAKTTALSASWKHSLLCRLLHILINFIAYILNAVYERLKPVFEGSAAARIVFTFSEQAAGCLGWLMLVILIIPQEQWNNMYSLMGAAAVFAVHYIGTMRHKGFRIDVKTPGPYALMFLGTVAMSVIFSYDVSLSYRYFFFHATCALMVLVCVTVIRTRDDLLRVVGFAMAGLIVCCLYAVYQRASGLEVNRSFVDVMSNSNMPGRVFSFFENPNAYAKILVMLLPFGLVMAVYCRRWASRLLGLSAFILAAAALVMTISRAGWGGAAISIFLLVLLLKPSLIPALIVCGIIAVPFLPSYITARMLAIFSGDTSITSRIPVYNATIALIKGNWLGGVGLGMDVVKRAVRDGRLYDSFIPFIHAHNTYLQIWAETGVFGLLSFLASIIYGIRNGVGAVMRGGDKALGGIAAAGVCGIIGVLIFGLADYIWAYPRVMVIFWFVFGITLTAAKLNAEAAEK